MLLTLVKVFYIILLPFFLSRLFLVSSVDVRVAWKPLQGIDPRITSHHSQRYTYRIFHRHRRKAIALRKKFPATPTADQMYRTSGRASAVGWPPWLRGVCWENFFSRCSRETEKINCNIAAWFNPRVRFWHKLGATSGQALKAVHFRGACLSGSVLLLPSTRLWVRVPAAFWWDRNA